MQRAPIAKAVLKLVASRRVVFLVALAARLWVLAQLLPSNAWRDFYQYNEPSHIAWSIVSGSGYSSPWANTLAMPTAQQPPVYPYFLAGIFKLAGAYSYLSLRIAVGLNAVISSLTAVVILQIGKRIFGTPTGVLAAWIWSCWIYEAVVSIRLWEAACQLCCWRWDCVCCQSWPLQSVRSFGLFLEPSPVSLLLPTRPCCPSFRFSGYGYGSVADVADSRAAGG